MKEFAKPMSAFAQNTFMFIFSVGVLAAVVVYYGYIAIDRLGLETESRTAIVLDKQHAIAREAPYVNIVAGRPWVQSQETPEMFYLTLKSDNSDLCAAVTRPIFEAVKPGDTVHIFVQRRRLSGTMQVADVVQE